MRGNAKKAQRILKAYPLPTARSSSLAIATQPGAVILNSCESCSKMSRLNLRMVRASGLTDMPPIVQLVNCKSLARGEFSDDEVGNQGRRGNALELLDNFDIAISTLGCAAAAAV